MSALVYHDVWIRSCSNSLVRSRQLNLTKIPILMTSLREVVEGKPICQLLRAAANCLSKLHDGGIIWLFCLYETCQETNEHCICHGMPVNFSFLAAGQLVVAIVS